MGCRLRRRRAEVNEDTAIAGLRILARLMQGRYPNQLVFAAAARQFEEEEPRLRREGQLGAADFARVLLCWHLEDGRYRVVFGDLRTETVSADRLARLEGR